MSPETGESGGIRQKFESVRALSEALLAQLSDADATIQSMADASPVKWHLAHTTWFFETFVLRGKLDGYCLFDEDWPFLFNSYYEAEGPRHARARRGMLSRPSLDEVLAYRAHVDRAMGAVIEREDLAALVELGLNHEQQHQELLLTDIKHAFSSNPLGPAFSGKTQTAGRSVPDANVSWRQNEGGAVEIGHAGDGFAFDNEGPRHRVLLEPFEIASRLVTNREWEEFISDGGYRSANLWLSDGWAWAQQHSVSAPLYWRGGEHFTLGGWMERDPQAPVTHISLYEADAFASWSGCRLPTEFEWESVANIDDALEGNQLDEPCAAGPLDSPGFFGDCWQWTRSAYLPYPRFAPADGAVGEYNGKFMSGQGVLKGASCATPRGHSRASYRNFFYPHQRWQFTGLRLARDI
ncbi:MAG: ergothioneine biosynthesis protein EgtB [Sphingomonadaceae bacterium]|nr:ergothioneine biosynthesis protein EgtB [Sphingomonadaceae bacterium]